MDSRFKPTLPHGHPSAARRKAAEEKAAEEPQGGLKREVDETDGPTLEVDVADLGSGAGVEPHGADEDVDGSDDDKQDPKND